MVAEAVRLWEHLTCADLVVDIDLHVKHLATFNTVGFRPRPWQIW
jgi:hypothetical protein